MNKFLRIVILLWISTASWANDEPRHAMFAHVKAIQGEALLQRANKQQPLTVDMQLFEQDIISTVAKGQVEIQLADSSLIKIGAFSRLVLDKMVTSPQENNTFSALFKLAQGALRFKSHSAQNRDVQVQAGSITLGIRGTDVYAEVEEEKDLVCLVKGDILVQSGHIKARLTQPLQFFVVPKGKPPLPVSTLAEEKFKRWLEEEGLQ